MARKRNLTILRRGDTDVDRYELVVGLLVGRVAVELSHRRGAAARGIDPNRLLQGGAHIPPPPLQGTREALASAMHSVFLVGIPIAVAMLMVALALPERPLPRTLDSPADGSD